MKVIILAAGEQSRWGASPHPHLPALTDAPKHLALVAGEATLERTVRLLRELGVDRITIAVKDSQDPRYKFAGASRKRVSVPAEFEGYDVGKLAQVNSAWSEKDERVLILMGDVWWEQETLAHMVREDHPMPVAYGRYFPDGGEIFGFSLRGEHRDWWLLALGEAKDADQPGGWAQYRSLWEIPDHSITEGFLEVSDLGDQWTQDWDTVRDWDEWMLRYHKTPEGERPQ